LADAGRFDPKRSAPTNLPTPVARVPVCGCESPTKLPSGICPTGFTGGINWYRNIDRDWELTKGRAYKIDVPCLYIGAEDDVILPPSSANGMERMIPQLEKHTIKNCGHWTQQERPEEFNNVVIAWLNRHFSKKD
jgi:pimeloyl-ACP methyl ester carboxylesterase